MLTSMTYFRQNSFLVSFMISTQVGFWVEICKLQNITIFSIEILNGVVDLLEILSLMEEIRALSTFSIYFFPFCPQRVTYDSSLFGSSLGFWIPNFLGIFSFPVWLINFFHHDVSDFLNPLGCDSSCFILEYYYLKKV